MASPAHQIDSSVTVEEYLRQERDAEARSEYYNGVIVAMAGESSEHGQVSVNLVYRLSAQLDDSPCSIRTKDTKVRSGPPRPFSRYRSRGVFSYPDIVVICGEIDYYDERKDIILNPKVIFEVLSPSTENFDRGDKFQNYCIWNSSLSDYVLVSQTKPLIEHYRKIGPDDWNYRATRGLDAELTIESISCTLKFSEIYKRVEFPPSVEESEGDATRNPGTP